MKIIGIHGRARSGKDTLARFLVDHHGFHRVALADPLREFVSAITGIPYEALVDGPAKEEPLSWLNDRSPRYMMQTLGTEWGRQMVDDQLWLKVAHRRVEEARKQGYAGVVIPDVRFDNEAEFVSDLGGTVVEVVRPGVAAVAAHSSEAGVSPDLIHFTVHNDGTLLDLARYAETLAL
ncbi:adenylate kinase [uncultured Xanthomonas sp.]|uniref:deoxynucleotide monophosphate kinase family protein n=1 Tax=uncultured Xanthomonas sp. TaxID=152831 RepID=UPI0025FAB433|nr:adenylate kinase [uncultured Xanthomonas sp.]